MSKTLNELADGADALLLDWVKNGKPDRDDDGNEFRRPLTAAEITAVIRRLKDCGITAVATPGSTLDELQEAMGGNYRLPSMAQYDDQEDAATA